MAESTRILRIAPVMTGGTSLAVWMGGATLELYRLYRASDPVDAPAAGAGGVGDEIYRRLLELTRTRVEIDVLTGTSAGGLNAALLAVAVHNRTPVREFLRIRDTWQQTADLTRLLRRTDERDPPSLLRGQVFEDEVRRVFEQLARAGRREPSGDGTPADATGSIRWHGDVDLMVTVTTIEPVDVLRHDSTGAAVHEVDHAQQLSFRGDQFDRDGWERRLALAARTSAGIPGVFEPSRLAVGDGDVDLAGLTSFEGSRWAVDGGVVVNLPLTEALDRIYERSAREEVRRIALFVTPTPRAEPVGAVHDPDDLPSIRTALSTVVTAPRAEGVFRDLDRIEERNRRVRNQADLRAALGGLVGGSNLVPGRFERYRRARARASVAGMVDLWIASNPTAASAIDRDRLIGRLQDVRLDLQPTEPDRFSRAGGRSWEWGIRPVEHVVATVLGLLARMAEIPDRDDEPSDGTADRTTEPTNRERTLDAKARVHGWRRRVEVVRRIDERFWRRRLVDHPDPIGPEELSNWYERWPFADEDDLRLAAPDLRELGEPLPGSSTTAPPPEDVETARAFVFEKLRGAFFDVARILVEIRPIGERELSRVVDSTPDDAPAWRRRRADRAADVLAELRSLTHGTDLSAVRLRLLELHFLQVLLLGEIVEKEQKVELVVLSSDAPNVLDPGRRGAEKLAGPELARLGAFLKPSWRANDWMWGRLDAVHRLIRLLLVPDDIRRFDPEGVHLSALVEEFAGSVPVPVRAELAALREGEDLTGLPETVGVLTGVIQRSIARDELPRVAVAIDESVRRGGVQGDGGLFYESVAARQRPAGGRGTKVVPVRLDEDQVDDAELDELFSLLRVGDERFGEELGHRMAAATMSTAGVVGLNALTGSRSGLPVPAFAGPLRALAQGVAAVVGRLVRTDPVSRFVSVFLLVAAATIIGLRLSGVAVPGAFTAGSAAVLTLIFSWSLLRGNRVITALLYLLGGAIVVAAILGSDLSSVLHDRPDAIIGDPVAGEATATWKRWLFLNPFSAAPALVLLLAVVGIVRGFIRGEIPRLVGAVAAFGLGLAVPGLARPVLTGSPGSSSVKESMVDLAVTLHDWRFPVIVAVLGLGSLIFGLGVDTVVTRPLSDARARKRARASVRSERR